MKRTVIFSILNCTLMASTAFGMDKDQQIKDMGSKQLLLATHNADYITLTGIPTGNKELYEENKPNIIGSLASVNKALSIENAGSSEDERLTIDVSKIVSYPIAEPSVVNLKKLIMADPREVYLFNGTQQLNFDKQNQSKNKQFIIDIVDTVEFRDQEKHPGTCCIDQQKIKNLIDTYRKSPKPSWLENTVYPLAKGAGLITIGYLLCKYAHSTATE